MLSCLTYCELKRKLTLFISQSNQPGMWPFFWTTHCISGGRLWQKLGQVQESCFFLPEFPTLGPHLCQRSVLIVIVSLSLSDAVGLHANWLVHCTAHRLVSILWAVQCKVTIAFKTAFIFHSLLLDLPLSYCAVHIASERKGLKGKSQI